MDKVKILSNIYSEIAGVFNGKPFSVKLENGFAMIEKDLAEYIQKMFKDIVVQEIEKEAKKVEEAIKKEVEDVEKEIKAKQGRASKSTKVEEGK